MSEAIASADGEVRQGVRGWFARAHVLRVEVALVLALYLLYQVCRGFVDHDQGLALRHADAVVELERRLGIFLEGSVQDAVAALPGLDWLLAHAYVSLTRRGTGRGSRSLPVGCVNFGSGSLT